MSLAMLRRKPAQEDPAVLVIPVDELNTDKEYQRDLDVARAEKYAREWDPYLLNELTVAEREDGTYWVIDGAHRLYAAKKHGVINLRCFVVRSLTREQEADLFVRLNKNRRPVNAWDSFRAALAAKDKDAIRIKAVVEECGFSISRSGGPRSIKAVSSLQKVYRLGGAPLLRDSLELIAQVWEGDKDASDSIAVVGVSAFLHQYGTHAAFNRERLVEVLSKVPVARVMREVKGMGDGAAWTNTASAGVRAMFVIRHHYNKNLRTRKMPMPVDVKGRTMGSAYDLPGGAA